MPWNYPLWQLIRYLVPTIIAGNTCLIKPAHNTYKTAQLLTEFFKGQQLSVCRFVSIYNELASAKDWEFNNTQKNPIPTDGITVADYLSKLDPVLRNAIVEYTTTPVVHK